MKENFDPKDFASFEELPEDEKPEFEPVEEGFALKEFIGDKEKAERMAHVENSIRSKIDEAVQIAMAEIKERMVGDAEQAGDYEGKQYDREKRIVEFIKGIENVKVFKLKYPVCCGGRRGDEEHWQIVAYGLIGSGAAKNNSFVMQDCSRNVYFVKDRKIFGSMGASEFYDLLEKEKLTIIKEE